MSTLELKHGVISTDEHVQETPDVWTTKMPAAKFGDDIPHLEEREDGSQIFLIQGKPASMRLSSWTNARYSSRVATRLGTGRPSPSQWEGPREVVNPMAPPSNESVKTCFILWSSSSVQGRCDASSPRT